MNEAEKREFLSQLVDNVQIYEERKENGQWLKSIEFKLPIIEKEFGAVKIYAQIYLQAPAE